MISVATVKDGTSNTCAFSERIHGIGNGAALFATEAFVPGTPTSNMYNLAITSDADLYPSILYYQGCKALTPSAATPNIAGVGINGWTYYQELMGDVSYTHVMPPNSWSCRGGVEMSWDASSRHPGVVNVLFLDGGVKAIKQTINNTVWWAIGSKAGGEVVSADSY